MGRFLGLIATTVILLLLLPVLNAGQGPAALTASAGGLPELEGLEEFVGQVQDKWRAPGIAVGIVKNGKPVYLRGFGVRDLDKNLPVTPDTVFSIASSTKSFTSTGIGILVDEGKLSWDKRVGECLPWFELKDPVADQYATIRDMLCHRTGLPGHILMQYAIARQYDRREIVRRLRFLEPNVEFRRRFQYQNQMYQVATVVIEELSGQSWEEFTRQRIFEPLEMQRSRFSQAGPSGETDNTAKLYTLDTQGEVVESPSLDEFWKAISGSGSIHSTAREMCNWLIMNLNGGQFNGRQIISKRRLTQLNNSQVVVPGALFPEVLHQTYTLAWNAMVYRGYELLNRPGGAPGITSQVAFLPAAGIGVVIFANLEADVCHMALLFGIVDRLLGLEPIPWLDRLWPIEERSRKQRLQMRQRKTEAGEPPSHALADYVGEYENPGYGTIRITIEGGTLFLDLLETVPLRHRAQDLFEGFQKIMLFEFQFGADSDGNIDSLAASLEPTVKPIVFKRIRE